MKDKHANPIMVTGKQIGDAPILYDRMLRNSGCDDNGNSAKFSDNYHHE